MTANSVFFPFTNPSKGPDKGQAPAVSAWACQNPQVRQDLPLSKHSSGECRCTDLCPAGLRDRRGVMDLLAGIGDNARGQRRLRCKETGIQKSMDELRLDHFLPHWIVDLMPVALILFFLTIFVGHIAAIHMILKPSGITWRDYNTDASAKNRFKLYLSETYPTLPTALQWFFSHAMTIPVVPFVWLFTTLVFSRKDAK